MNATSRIVEENEELASRDGDGGDTDGSDDCGGGGDGDDGDDGDGDGDDDDGDDEGDDDGGDDGDSNGDDGGHDDGDDDEMLGKSNGQRWVPRCNCGLWAITLQRN